jgi:hypothetical protein
MNAFCSDCTWMHPLTLDTLHYCMLLSLSFNSHDHTRMPLLKAVQDAQTNIALLTVIQGGCCFFLQGTHTTAPLLAFGRPVLQLFDFQSAELGWRWGWPASRHATNCHIGFLALYYQIAHKNLPEFFVSHVPTTGLVDKKKQSVWSCLSDGKTTSWSTFMFSGQFHSCWPSCLICPQTPYWHCSPRSNGVW